MTSRMLRRARPLLGTLVEVGADASLIDADFNALFDAAFEEIAAVQHALSRFDPASEVARFNAMARPGAMRVGAHAQVVLGAAQRLHDESGGLFDITQGRAAAGWSLDGDKLIKRDAATRIDLGGIAKGHAVDRAIQALQRAGAAAGWVNAGGDLRAFGAARLAVLLRDEQQGEVREFGTLRDAAFATSHGAPGSRSRLHGAAGTVHVSVSAPQCLWADALTKIVAASGDAAHPLLARFEARAWLH